MAATGVHGYHSCAGRYGWLTHDSGQPLNKASVVGCESCLGAGLEKAEFSPPMRTRDDGLGPGCGRLACGGVAGGPGDRASGDDGGELLGDGGTSAPGLSRFMRWCLRHFARLYPSFREVGLSGKTFASAHTRVVGLFELFFKDLQLVRAERCPVSTKFRPVR